MIAAIDSNIAKAKIKMIFIVLYFLFFIISCSDSHQFVRWNARQRKAINMENPVTVWRNGTQIQTISNQNVDVAIQGFSNKEFVAILVSVNNRSNDVINIFPYQCRLIQKEKNIDFAFFPKRPREIRKEATTSQFVTTLFFAMGMPAYPGANASRDEKLNYELLKNNQVNQYVQTSGHIQKNKNSLIDCMLKDHTLYPNETYEGYLLFDKSSFSQPNGKEGPRKFNLKRPFYIGLVCGEFRFIIKGKVGDNNDELDTPEDIYKIDFSDR